MEEKDEDFYYETENVNDFYKIKQNIIEFKREFELFELNLKKFLGPKRNKEAGIRANKSIRSMKKISKEITKKIIKTRQDYSGDYS